MSDISAVEKVVSLIGDLATVVADVKGNGIAWKEIPEALAVLADISGIQASLPEIQWEVQTALADPATLAKLLSDVIEATLKLIAATA